MIVVASIFALVYLCLGLLGVKFVNALSDEGPIVGLWQAANPCAVMAGVAAIYWAVR